MPQNLLEQLRTYTVVVADTGDIIATGTPAGVGPLQAGDRVEVALQGLGVLTNLFMADAS